MAVWLFKTEPDVCSIDDLRDAPAGITRWDGIRNYQARNLLRDRVRLDDQVLVYHSSCKVPALVGLSRVVRAAYPDPAQFDPSSPYYDPKAAETAPRWVCVDIGYVAHFQSPLTLAQIRTVPELASMTLLTQGRLSVQPVEAGEWRVIAEKVGII